MSIIYQIPSETVVMLDIHYCGKGNSAYKTAYLASLLYLVAPLQNLKKSKRSVVKKSPTLLTW